MAAYPLIIYLALISLSSLAWVHGRVASIGGQAVLPQMRNHYPTPVMIENAGYPSETYTVTSDDGYILEIHRIPHGKGQGGSSMRPVVLLQHGLLCSSADWVLAGPEKGFAFILADAGYDVWMGNYRGNTYSRNHIHLDPDEFEFWDFSWDEMGKLDLPATINLVLNITKQEDMFYIGHSMGTTTLMAMLNTHPEMQDHIKMASLMAPVAYVEHMRSPIRFFAYLEGPLSFVLDMLGIGEFLPSNTLMAWLADMVCDNDTLQGICSSLLFLLAGFDESQLDDELLETILAHTPAGASTHTILQYAQEVKSKTFNAFDHGRSTNLGIYGSSDPPLYSIDKVKVPVAIYWGLNDWLCHPEDVYHLTSQLPNMIADYEVPYEQWNHLDFLWGKDANTLVYPEVLKNMEGFQKR